MKNAFKAALEGSLYALWIIGIFAIMAIVIIAVLYVAGLIPISFEDVSIFSLKMFMVSLMFLVPSTLLIKLFGFNIEDPFEYD